MRTVAFSAVFLSDRPCIAALAADPTGDWRRSRRCRQHPGCRMQWQHVGRGGLGEDARRPRQEQSRCLETEQAHLGNADPDRHEEKACRRSMGRPSLQRQGRPDVQPQPSSRSAPIRWRFKAACWASSAAAKPGRVSPAPIPSSPANSMAKGAPKGTGAPRRSGTRSRPNDPGRQPRQPLRRRPPAPSARLPNPVRSRRPASPRHRRYLPTPRHRAVCPLAPAGTAAPRPAS